MNHLVFAADTSGSTMPMLKDFISEIAGALDQGVADKLTVIYADTRVHDVDEFLAGDIVTGRTFEKGGGGTQFSDTFRYIKENIPDASCIVYLSDMEVNDYGEEPEVPLLWAVFSRYSQYDALVSQIPFGEAIHVSN
jgi:predicted metal-dependent peptidase